MNDLIEEVCHVLVQSLATEEDVGYWDDLFGSYDDLNFDNFSNFRVMGTMSSTSSMTRSRNKHGGYVEVLCDYVAGSTEVSREFTIMCFLVEGVDAVKKIEESYCADGVTPVEVAFSMTDDQFRNLLEDSYRVWQMRSI